MALYERHQEIFIVQYIESEEGDVEVISHQI